MSNKIGAGSQGYCGHSADTVVTAMTAVALEMVKPALAITLGIPAGGLNQNWRSKTLAQKI